MKPQTTAKLNYSPQRSEAALYPQDGMQLIISRNAQHNPDGRVCPLRPCQKGAPSETKGHAESNCRWRECTTFVVPTRLSRANYQLRLPAAAECAVELHKSERFPLLGTHEIQLRSVQIRICREYFEITR